MTELYTEGQKPALGGSHRHYKPCPFHLKQALEETGKAVIFIRCSVQEKAAMLRAAKESGYSDNVYCRVVLEELRNYKEAFESLQNHLLNAIGKADSPEERNCINELGILVDALRPKGLDNDG